MNLTNPTDMSVPALTTLICIIKISLTFHARLQSISLSYRFRNIIVFNVHPLRKEVE